MELSYFAIQEFWKKNIVRIWRIKWTFSTRRQQGIRYNTVNYTLFNSNYTRPVNINYPVCPVCAFRCINGGPTPDWWQARDLHIHLSRQYLRPDTRHRAYPDGQNVSICASKNKLLQDRENFQKMYTPTRRFSIHREEIRGQRLTN